MRATGPAAGAAHATLHLRDTFFDSDQPRLRLLARCHPADPLAACKRGDVVPYDLRSRRRGESIPEIRRHNVVHRRFVSHAFHASKSAFGLRRLLSPGRDLFTPFSSWNDKTIFYNVFFSKLDVKDSMSGKKIFEFFWLEMLSHK